ncbi:ribonuclease HII, partial [Mycolicibacterium smegmatis]|uniref:ribonuclease HII n=1 Tax=Mycolicibacterium smegmatis TaxID=1772 RepID=UPI0023DB44BC
MIEAQAISWAVASVDNEEIDRINILQASFKAMHLAISRLTRPPGLLLIDGNRFVPYAQTPHHCIIKGDGKFASIAAASILAKTHRDAYLLQLHEEFPQYGWDKNKGYGTAEHRNAIEAYG